MKRIVMIIEAVEKRLLRWMRLVSVVVVVLALAGGALTLASSAISLSSSTDVAVAPAERVSFAPPGVRNEQQKPREPEPERELAAPKHSGDDPGEEPGPWDDKKEDVVEALMPLSVAADLGYTRQDYNGYASGVVDHIENAIYSKLSDTATMEDMLSQMEEALDGLVAYAEDLAEYYGSEIELDDSGSVPKAGKPIQPSFRAHLGEVMRHPLEGYANAFSKSLDASVARARREAERGAAAIREGAESLGSLPYIGAFVLVMLFLLLLFKIEISLTQEQAVQD